MNEIVFGNKDDELLKNLPVATADFLVNHGFWKECFIHKSSFQSGLSFLQELEIVKSENHNISPEDMIVFGTGAFDRGTAFIIFGDWL
jgi:hypothetical protein